MEGSETIVEKINTNSDQIEEPAAAGLVEIIEEGSNICAS